MLNLLLPIVVWLLPSKLNRLVAFVLFQIARAWLLEGLRATPLPARNAGRRRPAGGLAVARQMRAACVVTRPSVPLNILINNDKKLLFAWGRMPGICPVAAEAGQHGLSLWLDMAPSPTKPDCFAQLEF
jgi:hypothetical protein